MDVIAQLEQLLESPIINSDIEPSTIFRTPFIYEMNFNWGSMKDGINVGKWMLFAPSQEIDMLWSQVRAVIQKGVVWRSAKVSTCYSIRNGNHVICVYTYNYKDMNDIYNTNAILKSELRIRYPIPYKSDDMTRNGVKGSMYRF